MDVSFIKKLLKETSPEKIILKDHIKSKIEDFHKLPVDSVFRHIKNPDSLMLVQEQEPLQPDSRTFRVWDRIRL